MGFGEVHGSAKAPSNESLTMYEALFLPHSSIKEAAGRKFSPGTEIDGTPYGSPPLTRILIQPQGTSIDMGGSVNLRAIAYDMIDQREVEIPQVNFAWDTVDGGNQVLSSNSGESITISAALNGTLFVRARAGTQEAEAVVTINPVVAAIELSPASASVFVGDVQNLSLSLATTPGQFCLISNLNF
ncbi:MAG: hypothetical protein WKF84_06500 [Pyrinomonadaceae bacterium]